MSSLPKFPRTAATTVRLPNNTHHENIHFTLYSPVFHFSTLDFLSRIQDRCRVSCNGLRTVGTHRYRGIRPYIHRRVRVGHGLQPGRLDLLAAHRPGPHVDGATTHSKVFPLADYTPHIGVFKWKGDTLSLIRKISLKENDSTCFCGLPRSTGEGITGEKAYAPGGCEIITPERKGIDTEGLALSPDGTFWVSDEYGPYLLHFDADGILIEEYSPFNGKLPAHYALRQPQPWHGGSLHQQRREETLRHHAVAPRRRLS